MVAGIHIPERREILKRDDGLVTDGRYMFDKQARGIKEVSQMGGMAAVAG
jgi:hypothetical protein